MGLLKQTQQEYYDVKKSFTGDGTTVLFTVSNSQNTFPTAYSSSDVDIYIDNVFNIPMHLTHYFLHLFKILNNRILF